jgi:hypothetical protein
MSANHVPSTAIEKRDNRTRVHALTKPLFSEFKPSLLWFGSVAMIRSLAVTLIIVLVSDQPILQVSHTKYNLFLFQQKNVGV